MKGKDAATVAAQNRHKIEKDRRRKSYNDSQVQGTNNSSIVSKRSVEMIYNPVIEPEAQEWFKHFVPKGKRRSPAINRGYWIRMESIKQTVQRIQHQHDGTLRVVNLGCGFDPFPFKTMAESDLGDYEFFDFDYPELVAKKMAMIKQAPEIMKVVGFEEEISEEQKSLGVVMCTTSYKLVGCDLKNTDLYKRQLGSLLHSGTPTVFIAEVSLAYMKPEHANKVIEILSQLKNAHVLVLEQIMPAGDNHFFAQKMLYHFSHLRSPLQCVEIYPTRNKQSQRFQQFFSNVEMIDLFESWKQLVPEDTKRLVASVEDFDEWEEFLVFCQHYVVIHATDSGKKLFTKEKETPHFDEIRDLNIKQVHVPFSMKFPACASTDAGTYIHGGLFQTRSDELIYLQNNHDVCLFDREVKPSARMCHTLTDLKNGNLLLIGGRARPGVELNDVWVFNLEEKAWRKVGKLEEGLARHCAVNCGVGSVLVFGKGKFKVIQYTGSNFRVEDVASERQVPNLTGCSLLFDINRAEGYIVGGMFEESGPTINDGLYMFTLDGANMQFECVERNHHFARIGCLSKLMKDELWVLGGAGQYLQGQASTVISYGLSSKSVCGMRIPDEVWRTHPVFIGSQLSGRQLSGCRVVGGGAICYSFGSCYNKGYDLEYDGRSHIHT